MVFSVSEGTRAPLTSCKMDVKEIIRYLFSIRPKRTQSNAAIKLIVLLSVICIVPMCCADLVHTSEEAAPSGHQNKSWYPPHELVHPINVGRTFGRPLKKLQAALLPVMFKLGVISTLIFITFILVVKGVGIGLMLLMFKLGAGFAHLKSEFIGHQHHQHHGGWAPPYKEVHLHVIGHNAGHNYIQPSYGHDTWNRASIGIDKLMNPGLIQQGIASINSPSLIQQGITSINTPYGHYVRTGDPTGPSII